MRGAYILFLCEQRKSIKKKNFLRETTFRLSFGFLRNIAARNLRAKRQLCEYNFLLILFFFKRKVCMPRRCLNNGNMPKSEGFFSPGEANLTQEYWMYCKETWQCMADPPFGHVDIFQTSPRAVQNHKGGGVQGQSPCRVWAEPNRYSFSTMSAIGKKHLRAPRRSLPAAPQAPCAAFR